MQPFRVHNDVMKVDAEYRFFNQRIPSFWIMTALLISAVSFIIAVITIYWIGILVFIVTVGVGLKFFFTTNKWEGLTPSTQLVEAYKTAKTPVYRNYKIHDTLIQWKN